MSPIRTPVKLIEMVKKDEGFRNTLYIDTEGYRTIGIGFCLDKAPLPEAVAMYWCGYVLDNIRQRLGNSLSVGQTYKALNEPRQFAICNMAYQMGVGGVQKFLNMWAALDIEDYNKAAAEALDSVWAHQTRKRAKRIAEIIRTGKFTGY